MQQNPPELCPINEQARSPLPPSPTLACTLGRRRVIPFGTKHFEEPWHWWWNIQPWWQSKMCCPLVDWCSPYEASTTNNSSSSVVSIAYTSLPSTNTSLSCRSANLESEKNLTTMYISSRCTIRACSSSELTLTSCLPYSSNFNDSCSENISDIAPRRNLQPLWTHEERSRLKALTTKCGTPAAKNDSSFRNITKG